ncbi:TPA: TolC family outer membrane protein [Photobacterium damselae]|uniref:TolC family outer membrane protein n=1 Tax=Photobacterium damselae TaxID=38293 RepID=UPI00159FED7E|nr:TolC family outer membrane protein [Photobacterium damselae]NVO62637.1 TolC family outer membrane protein [Photobacterium damselae subsp. damselae]
MTNGVHDLAIKKYKLGRMTAKQLLALAVSSALFAPVVNSQTLEQTVAYTIETSPVITQSFNQFKAREEQVNQAMAGYLPTLDLTAGYGLEKNETPVSKAAKKGDIELDRSELGLSLRQNLFNGFFTTHDVDRLDHETSAAQWQLFATAEDMALQVAKVYLNYLEASQIVALAQENVNKHQTLYGQIEEKTRSGLGSTADLSQSKGRLARAKSNLVAAQNNLADAKSEYAKITNQAPINMTKPAADRAALPQTLEQALTLAKDNHPVLQAAYSDIQAAESEKDATQANYYPDIDLELSGLWSNESYDRSSPNDGDSQELKAGIQMRYNLFNGGKDTAREREAAYKIGEAKGIQQNTYRSIVDGTTLAWNAYQYLGEQKTFIQEHVAASKETQSSYAQQFKLGQRSLLDLLDSENELFEAKKDYLGAEFDELLAQYRLLNATGQLLSSLQITTPETWYGEQEYISGVQGQ